MHVLPHKHFIMIDTKQPRQRATFAGGCFWCTEAIFKRLKGVTSVTSGYTGGIMPHPTYEQVCTGTTGHAEAIRVEYDPTIISYDALLNVFFSTHDPTSLNRQGNDIGEQYRSVVFYHSDGQRQEAEAFMKKMDDEKIFGKPLVTQLKLAGEFYPAEDYHQNYLDKNPSQPYCQAIIFPKVAKMREKFATFLKQSD